MRVEQAADRRKINKNYRSGVDTLHHYSIRTSHPRCIIKSIVCVQHMCVQQ